MPAAEEVETDLIAARTFRRARHSGKRRAEMLRGIAADPIKSAFAAVSDRNNDKGIC